MSGEKLRSNSETKQKTSFFWWLYKTIYDQGYVRGGTLVSGIYIIYIYIKQNSSAAASWELGCSSNLQPHMGRAHQDYYIFDNVMQIRYTQIIYVSSHERYI
jgi:hypothetical protein